MESESWSRFFSSIAKRHHTTQQSRYGHASEPHQSRYDLYPDFEEFDGGDDELHGVFACPFCADDFDIGGLCCHIDDEHPGEDKDVICPICAAKVEMDLIGHITMQHGNFFKDTLTCNYLQRRRRFRRGSSGSHSSLSILRKEVREANLQTLFAGLSRSSAPSSASDPFLSSLIYTFPAADSSKDIHPESLDKESTASESSEEVDFESSRPLLLSDSEQKERARRSEFVQGVVLSTIFDDEIL